MNNLSDKIGQQLEKSYVRDTYDFIADEFSGTRYKKWPRVEQFLSSLQPGSLLLDIGCGNGKYLDQKNSYNLGCDISRNLLTICRTRGFEVVSCDMMRLPFKRNQFDAIICIAALHHIATAKRRLECLTKMVELLSNRQGNRLLIQVWSYEQELEKNNPYLKKAQTNETSNDMRRTEKVCLGQEKLVMPVHKNRTPFEEQDLLVPFKKKQLVTNALTGNSREEELVEHLRYYHVFKEKELDMMILEIPDVKIIESYYDKGNWSAIITKSNPVD